MVQILWWTAKVQPKPLEGKHATFSQKSVTANANAAALTVCREGDQRQLYDENHVIQVSLYSFSNGKYNRSLHLPIIRHSMYSMEESQSYMFETTWVWVNDDRIMISCVLRHSYSSSFQSVTSQRKSRIIKDFIIFPFFPQTIKWHYMKAMNVVSDSAVGGCSWIRDWITSYLASFLTDGRKLRVRYQPHKTRAVIHRLPIHISAITDEANCRMPFYQIEFQTE